MAICDKLIRMEQQAKRSSRGRFAGVGGVCIAAAGSLNGVCISQGPLLGPGGINWGAKEEEMNWNFKMVLIVCTPPPPSHPHPTHASPSHHPPPHSLYLNHTSNNDLEERGKSERGSTLRRSSLARILYLLILWKNPTVASPQVMAFLIYVHTHCTIKCIKELSNLHYTAM